MNVSFKFKNRPVTKQPTITCYLNIKDFVNNLSSISITQTSDIKSSLYMVGNATVFNSSTNKKSGICSASFLCQKNNEIFVDIANYLTLDNGLVISWLTPARPLNLESNSIINSMVTECIVESTTKIGINPFYGMKFNMVVSSKEGKITFTLTKLA